MTRTIWVRTACSALLLALCAGCAGEEASADGDSASTPATEGPMTIAKMGAALDCKPQQRGKAADYRQAVCEAPSGKYLLNTFESDRAQNDWLEYSKMYGGTYLVGPRWIVVSKPQLLTSLRERLGGRLVNANRASPDPSTSSPGPFIPSASRS